MIFFMHTTYFLQGCRCGDKIKPTEARMIYVHNIWGQNDDYVDYVYKVIAIGALVFCFIVAWIQLKIQIVSKIFFSFWGICDNNWQNFQLVDSLEKIVRVNTLKSLKLFHFEAIEILAKPYLQKHVLLFRNS